MTGGRICTTATFLRLSNRTNVEHFLGFCLQALRQAGPPQRIDCLACNSSDTQKGGARKT